TQAFSWPWIFYINVPVGVAAFLLSLRLIPESIDEHAARSFDGLGAVTVTGGLMALVYAIVKAPQDGWTAAVTLGTFAISAVLLVSFVVIELRAAAPLVRLDIFRVRTLTAANVVMFLVASGLFAMFFFNSLCRIYLPDVFPAVMLPSLGMGAVSVPLTLVATMGLADSDQGLASGLFNTSQQVGGAVGLAILATLAASHTSSGEKSALVHG